MEDPVDAYTFAHVNDGNAVAMPFAKGFGWGGELNLEYCSTPSASSAARCMVGLAMPQQYGIAGFRRENLPILPSSFILLPRQVREGKEYKADPGVVKQLGILRELFGMAERIIVATDAGREGELIFRYIYSYLECRTPFVRLWISSLTDRAIREGLQHLRPGNEYDNL